MSSYITSEQLKNAAVANESDNDDIWELLSDGVSRLFDRQCEVADDFFAKAGDDVTLKSYRGNNTRYLKPFPYIADSITIIDIDGTDYFTATVTDRQYREKDNFLIFDFVVLPETVVNVTSRYGFADVPADIQFACVEQALAMWRRKDLAFAELSGVSSGVVNAEFSPTFATVTTRYRDIYSERNYFA